jgi:LPXTG-motif cell wall-anchored protein
MSRLRLSFLVFCMLVLLVSCPRLSLAQPGDPRTGDPDSSVPLTGIEVLVGLGSLFGVKKIFESRKKNKID